MRNIFFIFVMIQAHAAIPWKASCGTSVAIESLERFKKIDDSIEPLAEYIVRVASEGLLETTDPVRFKRELSTVTRSFRYTLLRMRNSQLRLLLQEWFSNTVQRRGFLEGLKGEATDPKSWAALEKDSRLREDTWRAVYNNVATIFSLVSLKLSQNLMSEIQGDVYRLFQGALLHEYTRRLLSIKDYEKLSQSYENNESVLARMF